MAQAITDPRSLRSELPLVHSIDELDLTWRVLGTLNLFRLFVAVLLLGLFFASGDPKFFGAGSLILPLHVPAFFAALATLVVLGEQFFSQMAGVSDSSSYPAAGVLGAYAISTLIASRASM